MPQGLPPNPSAYRSLEEWAQQFYDFYLANTRVSEENDPLPILLAHQTPNELYRATTDGVIMYEPISGKPVISINGEFVPLLLENDLEFSPFGELIVTQEYPIIELNSSYGTSVKRDVVTTTNSATVSPTGGEIELATGSTADSVALLESAEAGRYIPGFAARLGCGMRIPTQPTGNEVFEWGGVDATTGPNSGNENGFWFGYDATGMYVARATGGTVSKTYQADWNRDTMDGSGGRRNPSKFTLDIAKGQIYQILFSYYGHGPIIYIIMMMDSRGRERPYMVHSEKVDGSVSIANPSLFLFQEANNGGDASDVSCFVGGRSYTILGNYQPAIRATAQVSAGVVNTDTNRVPIVTLKRKTGEFDKSIKLLSYNVIATTEDSIIEVVLDGTLTGASYEAIDGVSPSETALEKDTSATAISGGEVIFATLVGADKDKEGVLGTSGSALSDLEIPRDQPATLTVRTLTGTGTATGALTAKEEW